MENLQKEFVPYELALRMKDLGFDEPCFGYYNVSKYIGIGTFKLKECNSSTIDSYGNKILLTPTYSQTFRWFREKHNLDSRFHTYTHNKDGNRTDYMHDFIDGKKTSFDGFEKTYEEAEQTCLEKLIEIVKNK